MVMDGCERILRAGARAGAGVGAAMEFSARQPVRYVSSISAPWTMAAICTTMALSNGHKLSPHTDALPGPTSSIKIQPTLPNIRIPNHDARTRRFSDPSEPKSSGFVASVGKLGIHLKSPHPCLESPMRV
jgi:hypothetical protein